MQVFWHYRFGGDRGVAFVCFPCVPLRDLCAPCGKLRIYEQESFQKPANCLPTVFNRKGRKGLAKERKGRQAELAFSNLTT